jgi:hypothetical protein
VFVDRDANFSIHVGVCVTCLYRVGKVTRLGLFNIVAPNLAEKLETDLYSATRCGFTIKSSKSWTPSIACSVQNCYTPLGLYTPVYTYNFSGGRRDEIRGSGEDYITRSLMIGIPYQILFGWSNQVK